MTATTKKKNYNDNVVKFIRYNNNGDTIFKIVLLLLLGAADILLILNRERQESQQEYQEQYISIHNDSSQSIQYNILRSSFQVAQTESIAYFDTSSISNLSIPEFPTVTYMIDDNDNSNNVSFYDNLSDWEIQMVEMTIQHEVGNFSKEYKTCVAELIYNRILSDDFPDTVTDVLFQSGQFQGISNWLYSGIVPDEETKEVVKAVFSQDSTSHPATFYYNPALSEYDSIVWFEYSGDVELVFEYTENNWGIDYTTRFFV